MDDRLETDERPGNHGKDVHDLHGVSAFRRKRRRHRGEAPLVPRERGGEHDGDAHDENTGENHVERDGEPPADDAQRAAERRCGDAEEHFAQIYLESGHVIVEAELESVAEKESRQKNESGGIGPQDRHVSKP